MSREECFRVMNSPLIQGLSNSFDRVSGAIRDAASRTGVDFNYLLNQAKVESGLNANAKAKKAKHHAINKKEKAENALDNASEKTQNAADSASEKAKDADENLDENVQRDQDQQPSDLNR